MKSRPCIWMSAACLATALSMAIQLPAQDSADNNNNHQPRYRLIEIGTFGGPDSYLFTGPPLFRVLNDQGTFVGSAATSTADPYYPNCFTDCYINHTVQWKNGVLTDLGALPGSNSSGPFGINEFGTVVGVSQNGSIDPLTGFPEYDAVAWNNGGITNMGTFGGNISVANALNDWGQVAGLAANTIPDQFASGLGPCATFDCWPVATQLRAFLWQNGRMHDLGTLGGNDADASLINDLGILAGVSYTNTTPNPTTGLPTQDPFIWVDGKMVDLGSLGGTSGYPNWLNLWGQVVGQSNVAGDQAYHPFLWSGGTLRDLGTFGGATGAANWINDAGQVVGQADLPGGQCQGMACQHHAFLWRNGTLNDLGTVGTDPCSKAFSINLASQVVGESAPVCGGEYTASAATLWQNGTVYDLNTLIPPGSGLTLNVGWDINDQGMIAGQGILANGEERAFVLIPCYQNDPSGCQNRLLGRPSGFGNRTLAPDKTDQLRKGLAHSYHGGA
jgi:probable HAF family extracellular repeat protein